MNFGVASYSQRRILIEPAAILDVISTKMCNRIALQWLIFSTCDDDSDVKFEFNIISCIMQWFQTFTISIRLFLFSSIYIRMHCHLVQ